MIAAAPKPPTFSTPIPGLPEGSSLLEVDHPLVAAIATLPQLGPLGERPHLSFPHLSNSQVSTIRRCGAKYYFKYALRRSEPADSSLAFGSAFHAAMHHLLVQKMETHHDEDCDLDAAVATAFAALDAQMAKDPGLKMKPRYRNGPPETPATLKDGLNRAVRHASTQLIIAIDPIACEQGYVIYWRDQTILPFVGYADAIINTVGTSQSVEHAILDFKTSSSEKQPLDLELDNALTAYAFAHELATGVRTRQTLYAVYVRKKEPSSSLLSSTRDASDLRRLHSIAKIATAQIGAGLYLPADTAFACAGCTFRAECRTLFGGPREVPEYD